MYMFRMFGRRRYRNNITITEFFVVLFVMLMFSGMPLWFIIFAGVVVAFFIYGLEKTFDKQDRATKRKDVLKKVGPFLAPYRDIWKNLKLSNKYCILRLGNDGVMITAKEKIEPYRRFRIISSKVHGYKDLWEMFCLAFSHDLTYDMLLELCDTYKLTIIEENVPVIQPQKQDSNSNKKANLKPIDDLEKLDINNCSEVEMTALPGVSIVMAKRAVKRREEIGGFKTIDEFFSFLELKLHMQEQLRYKIVAKKKKGSLHRQVSSERQIDI